MKVWLNMDDYPRQAFNKGISGYAVTTLLIDPTGEVESCEVVLSEKHPAFGPAVCAAVARKKPHYRPATDGSGAPIYGVVRGISNFSMPAMSRPQASSVPKLAPTAVLRVSKLPSGASSPLDIEVVGLFDDSGSLEQCALSAESAAYAQLGKIACEQLRVGLNSQPVLGKDGKAVRYATQLTVRFEASDS